MMKKLTIKRTKKAKEPVSTRITNDTVAEHREKILAGGKRFKYPVQYSRHKLVINAVIIGIATIAILVGFGWQQLYLAQNSSSFFYRVSQIIPLPVASVDGEPARYSDYLLNYRASEHYLSKYDEISPDSEDGKLQLQYKKREALDIAIADAYARKVAKEQSVAIDTGEVEKSLELLRTASNGTLTKETSDASSRRILGLSGRDLETLVRNSLLRGKAAFAIDAEAKKIQQEVDVALEKNKQNFERTQGVINKKYPDAVTVGVSGLISRSNMFNGLRADDIAGLEKGKPSSVMRSVTGDGYFYVRVLEKTDTQVSFAFLQIPLTQFDESLATLKDNGSIDEYIAIDIDQPESTEEAKEEE